MSNCYLESDEAVICDNINHIIIADKKNSIIEKVNCTYMEYSARRIRNNNSRFTKIPFSTFKVAVHIILIDLNLK